MLRFMVTGEKIVVANEMVSTEFKRINPDGDWILGEDISNLITAVQFISRIIPPSLPAPTISPEFVE
jgi:hypothetical protein